MHPGPRVDSKNFDIAVGDNDYAQQPSGARPLRQTKIRNSGGGNRRAVRASDWPGRPAGDQGWLAINSEASQPLLYLRPDVLHIRFQIAAEINMHPSLERHCPGAAHDLTQIFH
jgi:hypothetical protein